MGGQFFDQDEQIVWFSTGRRSLMRFNAVLRIRTTPEQIVEVANQPLNTFRANHLPFFWADYPPGASPGLGTFLTANGIPLVEKGMPAMTRNLDALPPFPRLEQVEILEVKYSRDQADWLDVHMEGFGEPPESRSDFKEYLEYTLSNPKAGWRHYIARWSGAPCAISTVLFSKESAGIYHLTTLPAFRRKGLGKALTLTAMQAAQEVGYSTAILFATPDGFPLYQKLGFNVVVTADLYAWDGSTFV